uniref:Uncharacterized protein n=1 Tax=uncultured marine virus TaxID=186617 RepID=A0A0F7L678_9VIRU|nr:hypothetical protein [uncultured marine virus]
MIGTADHLLRRDVQPHIPVSGCDVVRHSPKVAPVDRSLAARRLGAIEQSGVQLKPRQL